jgi:ribosomal-protein-alanine N-acetyltransferase
VNKPSVSLRSPIVYLDDMNDFDVIIVHRWSRESIPERMTCRPIADFSEPEIIARFRERKDREDLRDLAVRRTDDGALLGRVCYFDLNPRNRAVEIGYLIGPEYLRKGYACEAMKLLLNYLFNKLGLNKATAQTGEFNKASIALLNKLGFKCDGRLRQHHELDGKMYDDLLFSILAEEFVS